MPENHPLLCDGAVKATEGGGRFVQLCCEDGRWCDGGWSEWNSGMELLESSGGRGGFYGGFGERERGLDLRALQYDSQHE